MSITRCWVIRTEKRDASDVWKWRVGKRIKPIPPGSDGRSDERWRQAEHPCRTIAVSSVQTSGAGAPQPEPTWIYNSLQTENSKGVKNGIKSILVVFKAARSISPRNAGPSGSHGEWRRCHRRFESSTEMCVGWQRSVLNLGAAATARVTDNSDSRARGTRENVYNYLLL